jgi:hypothetical protein
LEFGQVNIRVTTPYKAPDDTCVNVEFGANPPCFQYMAMAVVALAENGSDWGLRDGEV